MFSKLAKFFGKSKPVETPAPQVAPEPVVEAPIEETPAPKKRAAAKKTATKPRTPRTKK